MESGNGFFEILGPLISFLKIFQKSPETGLKIVNKGEEVSRGWSRKLYNILIEKLLKFERLSNLEFFKRILKILELDFFMKNLD